MPASPLHRASMLLLALLALAACGVGTDGATGVPGGAVGGGSGGGGTATGARALLGRWYRVAYFRDAYGFATSETTWDFGGDGVAARITTQQHSAIAGSQTQVSTARWHTEGATVVIRYVSPDTGTVRFAWRVEQGIDGERLRLDEVLFQRIR